MARYPMVELRDLSIAFGSKLLFEQLSHTFSSGQITTIRKTGVLDGGSTLLKCCAGLVEPASGVVLIGKTAINDLTPAERFQRISYCYEREGLISLFTVFNNLAIPLMYHGLVPAKQLEAEIYKVAEQIGIVPLLDLETFQLNDVQKRLVNLARAFLSGAQTILIDEMQSGMSSSMIDGVVHLLQQQVHRGATIVMVTTAGDEEGFASQRLQIRNRSLELLS